MKRLWPFVDDETSSSREDELLALFDRSAGALSKDARDRLLGSCLLLPSRHRPLPAMLLTAGAIAAAAVLAVVLVPALERPTQEGNAPQTTVSAAALPATEEVVLPESVEDWPMLATFAPDGGLDEFALLEVPANDEDLDYVVEGMEALLME